MYLRSQAFTSIGYLTSGLVIYIAMSKFAGPMEDGRCIVERSGNLSEVILLLGEWLQSRQSHQDINDPAFIETHNHEAQIADQIRLKSQTLTAAEAHYLLVDLEQMKQFIQEGDAQRKEREPTGQ